MQRAAYQFRIKTVTTLPLNACMCCTIPSAPVYMIPEVQPCQTICTGPASHLHNCGIHHAV